MGPLTRCLLLFHLLSLLLGLVLSPPLRRHLAPDHLLSVGLSREWMDDTTDTGVRLRPDWEGLDVLRRSP